MYSPPYLPQANINDNPDSILNSVSINMLISLMKSIGPANPMIFRNCCESLIDIFKRQNAKVLANIQLGSIQEETIRSLINYADEIALKTRKIDRSMAVGLLLGIAISMGSLQDVLRVVNHLRNGPEKLPEKAYSFVKQLNDRSPDWELVSPSQETMAGNFIARIEAKSIDG